ncbi:MAG: lipopolysaccharide heptosyltransferase II [Deltaproteobacteria bacterium]|jgi:heptosyltransferase-1/heptosyltransferase-2|nr:lipopolysaccharide heptosyltransferase II [Deltaproteobacteria bacterium]
MIYFKDSPLKPQEPAPKRILLIKLSSLGDVLHALPTLAALRTLWPLAQIHWAVEESLAPLLPGPPVLDEIVIFPRADLSLSRPLKAYRALRDLGQRLKANAYDLSIDLQALAKSSLVAFLAKAKRRLAYWETREGSFLVSTGVKGPMALGHVVERYLDVARYLGPVPKELSWPLPDFTAERDKLKKTLNDLGRSEPYVVFFPGASWATKQWAPANYAALGEALARKGYSLILGGASSERPIAEKIISLAPALPVANLMGATDLRGLLALASLGQAVVGSDSGPLHAAVAVGRPTVTLYGPNSPARTGAYGPLARNLASPAPCAPCFKKVCPREFICLSQIPVDQVLAATLKALAMGGG